MADTLACSIAKQAILDNFIPMSSMHRVVEIEKAIERLSEEERALLEERIISRRFGLDSLDRTERAELLTSLDEAESDLDAGRGLSAEEIRLSVRLWTGK